MQSMILFLVVAAALGIAGFLASQSVMDTPALVPEPIRASEALVSPVQPKNDSAPNSAGGRVQVPTTAPAGGDSAEALASGRVRGQIDVAPGVQAPAQFELIVESIGTPAKHFVFPGAERLVTFDLAMGRSVLSARAEGLASRMLVLERASDAAIPPFKLLLEPAGRLNGKIVDANGAALAELPVSLVAINCKDVRTVATDSEGRYAFTDIPVGPYRVACGAPDSPIAPVVPIEVVSTEVREVPSQVMPELGEGEISVLDRASQVVRGARVFGVGQRGGWIDGVSDNNGKVHARFLPTGTFFLNVTTEDGRTGQGPLEVNTGRIARAVIHIRN